MSNTSSDILRPETAAWCLNHTYPPNKKNKKVGITLPCQVSTPMSTEKYIPLKNQFFSNEQNELPKRRNEADVASQIRLQLRSEIFTQEKKLKHRALQQKRLPNEVPREAEALASQYR